MRNIIVFDVDGVLLDCTHRLHYITGEPKDWEKFFSEEEMRKDAPLPYLAMAHSLDELRRYEVVVATARPESTYPVTIAMLGLRVEYMRKDGDYRPDHIVKKEFLDDMRGGMNILFWVDDSPAVCDMLRANGVDVLQVGGRNEKN